MTAIVMNAALTVLVGVLWQQAPFARDANSGNIPANVTFPTAMRQEVERLTERSATLQRQFDRIEQARARVDVRVSPAVGAGSRRAYATLDRYSHGFIHARIVVPPGVDFVELLAHELEHVLEQIDGVDLASFERTGDATRTSDGVFETARAQLAGRTAASEVRSADVAAAEAGAP